MCIFDDDYILEIDVEKIVVRVKFSLGDMTMGMDVGLYL